MERSGQLLQRAAASLLHPRLRRRLGHHPRARDPAVPALLRPPGRRLPQPRTLRALRRASTRTGLDAESARLVEEYLKEFRQSGIQLDDAGQERLKDVNAELARLGTEFGQRVKEGMKSACPAAGRRRRPRRPARRRRRQRRRGRPHRRARGQVPADPHPAQQPARHGRPGEPGRPPAALRGLDRPRQRRRQLRCAGPGQGHGPAPRREGQPSGLRQLRRTQSWTARPPRISRPCRP